MALNEVDFGYCLLDKLKVTTDISALSNWAFSVFLSNCRDISPKLNDVLLDLSRMDCGEEFEYSVEELKVLAQNLIDNHSIGE